MCGDLLRPGRGEQRARENSGNTPEMTQRDVRGIVMVWAVELGMLGMEQLVVMEVHTEAGMGSMDFL